jgi:hypothetical protein
MIRYGHPYKVKWDFFIIFLAIFNAFEIPIMLSFEPEFMETVYWVYFDLIINLLFCIDILASFRTAYINSKTGEEIRGNWSVACHYLGTSFFIDVIASLPFDFIISLIVQGRNPILRLIGLIKLTRII